MNSMKGWHRLTSENEDLPCSVYVFVESLLFTCMHAKTQKLRWYHGYYSYIDIFKMFVSTK